MSLPWRDILVPVVSGLMLAGLLYLARYLPRLRVPTVLPATRRRAYQETILKLSKRPQLKRLDVLTPRLYSSEGRGLVARIQDVWAELNRRDSGEVRVITGDDPKALVGGAELVAKGIHVRVTPLDPGQLSYHLFGEGNGPTTVVNRPDRGGRRRRNQRARAMQFDGNAPLRVFESHFDRLWTEDSRPLESAIAERAMRDAGASASVKQVLLAAERFKADNRLDNECYMKVLQHLAFLHSAATIFIVGLPGAGKSLVRRCLAQQLNQMRLATEELTDYVFAYGDFIRESVQLDINVSMQVDPSSVVRDFSAAPLGAFMASREKVLEPALHALKDAVLMKEKSVISLVEFARSDILRALRVFKAVTPRSRVIYVEANQELRKNRLRTREQAPVIEVGEGAVRVIVSDNHRLPSLAVEKLYPYDNKQQLFEDRNWHGRVHPLSNESMKPKLVDEAVKSIISEIVSPYT